MNIFGFDVRKTGKKKTDPVNLTQKNYQIVRDNKGNIISQSAGSQIIGLDGYLGVFSDGYFGTNFVEMFKYISEVQFPINYITNRVKNANFVLKSWDGDDIIYDESNPVYRLLQRPNPFNTFNDLIASCALNYFLHANDFIFNPANSELLNSTGERWRYTDRLYSLPSHRVDIIPKSYNIDVFSNTLNVSDIIDYYRMSSYGKNFQAYPAQIIHSRDNYIGDFTTDYFKGLSRLFSQKYPVANLCAVYEARNVIYTKRGALGALIRKGGDADGNIAMTPDEKEKLREESQQTYGITGGRDPYIIYSTPVEYVQMGSNIQALQPFEETFNDAVQISGAFNIPSCLIPRKESSTYDNQKSAEINVYDSIIIPYVANKLNSLNDYLNLGSKAGCYIDADWSRVSILKADEQKKQQTRQAITNRCKVDFWNGIITLNMWRIELGVEAVKTDSIYDKTILQMDSAELEKIRNILK